MGIIIGYVTNLQYDGLEPLLAEMNQKYDVRKFYNEAATFKDITETLPPESVIIWRMLNAQNSKTKQLAEKLAEEGYILINSHTATTNADDKLETFKILSNHKIPTIPTWECAAGVNIPENHIVKPRFGMKGENVLFGNITLEKIFEPTSVKALAEADCEWVMQPYIPESSRWLRVLVVNGEPIVAYRRIPPQGRNIANVSQGARREYVKLDSKVAKIATRAAETLNLTIAGIDITHAPHLVVEANSVPAIPEEAAGKFSKEMLKHFSQTID